MKFLTVQSSPAPCHILPLKLMRITCLRKMSLLVLSH